MSIKREAEGLLYPDPTLGLQDKLGADFETLEKVLELVEKYGTMKDAFLDAERLAMKLWNDFNDVKELLSLKNQVLDEINNHIELKVREGEDIEDLEFEYREVYNSINKLERKKIVLKNQWETAELQMLRRKKMELWFKNYK